MKPVVGISLGDPSGIGPEVVAGALAKPSVRKALTPVVFGDAGVLGRFPLFRKGWTQVDGPLAKRPSSPTVCAISSLPAAARKPGKPTEDGARAQLAYVRAAVAAAQAGFLDALCTAPVSKEQISSVGAPFFGHTELLAEAFQCDVLMLMDGPNLKVALATNHAPLAAVSGLLRKEKLVAQLQLLSQTLKPLFRRAPRIAVCGLNPHAGEGGLLGREELDVIAPAIEAARAQGVQCTGPHPADGLFAQSGKKPFDVALAMYHDQGLIVVKATDFKRTVNVTLGLPLPRTSPDHGTAYSLAGKGKADAAPMTAALLKAAELARVS